ncbi:hypothetical protein A4D02_23260 [Niastella koreensis]|uniref:Uncharacterized protein n=2 Tax=Niastella koreensis TaxID=354356 RepID=G8TBV0_NIAKG|nr:hypothetical protein [Niastella koreensis]AEV98232.1 hypothetical protein Niako_1874 [Niastella koreensis GR20-10]OQP53310.1 hypothetical protein A4D02_23260 [Niastella koreensis]
MNKYMLSNDLETLLAEKSDVCISVIMPTHRLSPGKRTDPVELNNLLENVKLELQKKHDNATIAPLTLAMDELYEQIDFMHNTAGIGIFISAGVKKLIPFFFPVKERVTIAQAFDTRDLLYESYYDTPYVVLQLSQKETRLFNGHLNSLTAITDANFPKKYEDEYEYSRHNRGNSNTGHSFVKEIEKDRSAIEEIRFKNFFRETDKLLNNYLRNKIPLIVTGENKDLSYFRQVTTHEEQIACNVPGNYANYNEQELGALTWQAMNLFLNNNKDRLVRDFTEKTGEGLGITGIDNCWRAVQEGRGYKLLVEKDYSVPGYLMDNDEYDLQLHEPGQAHRTLPDAVSSLIQMVHEKKGEVVIVENDVLRDYRRMALITRY